MSLLRDHAWRLKYTPDNADLVRELYLPALSCAVHYNRLTGFFAASALALAARGVERLVANGGRMRMIVGCTLEEAEVQAIEKGESLKAVVEARFTAMPLVPPDAGAAEALELLAWMVAQGILEIRVAVPCDRARRPIPAQGIFHEKAGIIEDKTGERIAFNGSLNETASGWTRNWESLNVFTSWNDPARVDEEIANFARIWADQANHVRTIDVPTAAADDLLRFLPKDDRPARLKALDPGERRAGTEPKEPADVPAVEPPRDVRREVWEYIAIAATLPHGGVRVGEATAAVTPWPHQVRAFHRLYDTWPPRLLIADEVGLGKTIQAGMLLRQAWLAGRAKRILVMAPKGVCRQWQIELREKFNLNWPIYDGGNLTWYPSPARQGVNEQSVARDDWHREPAVIVSSHLVRRADRQAELLQAADPWDLVIVDEAHHARRSGMGAMKSGTPNAMLKLLRGLVDRTQGLVLLTATPMQVHPVEVFDLLRLLGLPPEWGEGNFLAFFDKIAGTAPSHEDFEWLAEMFRAIEATYGETTPADLKRLGVDSRLRAKRILSTLRDPASIPRRQMETADRKVALQLIQRSTPVNRLISRHTRDLLRRYYKAGKISTPIADRSVDDRFIDLSPPERAVYDAVEDYIATTYNQASAKERNAIGFVMTVYRKRLASSFFALARTLEKHLQKITWPGSVGAQIDIDEDLDDLDDSDADEAAGLEQQALALEERGDIENLLNQIRQLAPDTKAERLRGEIGALRSAGYRQVMVFTQFTDTMDFLREQLAIDGDLRVMCFSGRGGEVRDRGGGWQKISRDEAKRRFRDGEADVLLCTDAAAEGLNFQFCGALVNYDLPWNPMRVEQRIGRIDRLGQQYPIIRIVNLHYANTVEADVYHALRQRIGLFESVVGRLQPILAKLGTTISSSVLQGKTKPETERQALVTSVENDAAHAQQSGFDLDEFTDADVEELPRAPAALSLDDLDKVISSPNLLAPGLEASPLGAREYRFLQPGLEREVRVTTDPNYYEQHAETLELWSPGSPTFPEPVEVEAEVVASYAGESLAGILTGRS